MDWPTLASLVLGAALAVVGSLVQEELQIRRRLRTTSRILAHEISRLGEYLEEKGLEDLKVSERLLAAVDDFKAALFDVDAAKFAEAYPLYQEVVDALEAQSSFRQELRLIVNILPKLLALAGDEMKTPTQATLLEREE